MSMIDISKKLSNDKPVIKIAEGKEYKICFWFKWDYRQS